MVRLPKISIVTPSFNQGQFLEETIKSVLDQNYPNLEYIIIDGGSTDNSVEIIKKYKHHLKFWVSEPDSGQSEAINKGIAHCTGDIFNWLNSDDVLLPVALEKISYAFNNNPLHVLSGTEIHFDEKGETVKRGTWLYKNFEHSLFHAVFYQPSTFWRFDIYKSLSPINEELHFNAIKISHYTSL